MGAEWPWPVASSSLIAETYSRLACLRLGLGLGVGVGVRGKGWG